MAIELRLQSLVILASNFNPSIFRESWLLHHGVFSAGELGGADIFTPNFVQVHSGVQFLAAPDRIQFIAPPDTDGREMPRLSRIVIEALPETPYKAVGFNFHWHFRPENEDLATFTHERFRPPVAGRFGAGTRFGLITIREINGARETSGFTTINIDGAEVLEVKMNYNYDLGDDGLAGGAIGALDQWDADRMEAERMCRSALTEAL